MEGRSALRYFISLLVFASIAAFWREFVTKKAGQSYDLGLFGILGIAFVGIAIATLIAKLITGRDPNQPNAPSLPTLENASAQDPAKAYNESAPATVKRSDSTRSETKPVFHERVSVSSGGEGTSADSGEWYVIHAGQEIGPFSLGEMVERAVIGKIKADDLVKLKGGLWVKAREVPALQEHFRPKQVQKEAIEKNFRGALVIGGVIGGIVLLIVGGWYWSNRPNAVAIYYRGLESYNDKDYDKAIEDFNEAIRINPKYALAFEGRGKAWSGKKEYDKAIKDFDEAIRLSPSTASHYSNRGLTWAIKQDHKKAIMDCDIAVALQRGAHEYEARGFVWSLKKDYDMAIMDYDEAIRLYPGFVIAFANRGLAWSAKGEHDKAIKDYDEAIRLSPEYDWAYNARGLAWSDKGSTKKPSVILTKPSGSIQGMNLRTATGATHRQK